MTCRSAIERLLKRPPGWPVLEVLAITAAALLVLTLTTCHKVPALACLPAPLIGESNA
jgi:hypothetical protein